MLQPGFVDEVGVKLRVGRIKGFDYTFGHTLDPKRLTYGNSNSLKTTFRVT